MKYEIRTRIIPFLPSASFFLLVFSFPFGAFAQSVSKKSDSKNVWELNSPAQYYRLSDLQNSPEGIANIFPHPTAILRVFDTEHTAITVRFPELGLLGISVDTVAAPTSTIGDTLWAYRSREPLYMLSVPRTRYFLFVDVWSKDRKILLDSRPFEFDMNTEAYKTAHLSEKHPPTTALNNLTLRRRFQPDLLPLSIETNPGWSATETLDSTKTYALTFHDPLEPRKLELSLTMHPADLGIVDSAMWKDFKRKAEMAFGAHGVATSSIGDFQIVDTASRRIVKAGYEFVTKNIDSSINYIAALLTPRAILLMLAPIDEPNQKLQVEYFQAIARSIKFSEP